MQGVRGEDRDAVKLVIEQVAIAGGDEVGLSGSSSRSRLAGAGSGCGSTGQAGVVLHELCGGESRGEHSLREFIPRDDLGELGQEGGAGAG